MKHKNLGGGSIPLATTAARFPLPPLRDAAPRNAQRGRLWSLAQNGSNKKLGWAIE